MPEAVQAWAAWVLSILGGAWGGQSLEAALMLSYEDAHDVMDAAVPCELTSRCPWEDVNYTLYLLSQSKN